MCSGLSILLSILLSVLTKCGTITTDISIGSGLDSDPTQFGYGRDEGILKSRRIGGPRIYNGLGSGIREEDLVRRE